eukprot:TRINITY_DN75518_c0_g1_i1.p1 TRINITY_DN75518_c0_g1~~TRINITY_DN75518_c0_g1_i1.p1  ORF type:complete len:265 (-),score=40.43 TRINITY_DN75518_c0_g1_i1:139-891(-)
MFTPLRILSASVAVGVTAALLLRRKRQHKLRLIYLDAKCRGEPLRLALVVSGLPFEDVRASYEEIADMRTSGYLPFGQVPALVIDGVPFGQSAALLRWIGRQGGLYPSHLELQIDAALESIADLHKEFPLFWYNNALVRSPKTGQLVESTKFTPQLQAAVHRTLVNDFIPERFAQLERYMVKSGGPFLCGAEMTIADILLYVIVDGIFDGSYCEGIPWSVLQECPMVRSLVQLIGAHPRIAEWNADHRLR